MPTLSLLMCPTGAPFIQGKGECEVWPKETEYKEMVCLAKAFISSDIHIYLQLGLYLIRYIYLNQFNG
jgi:hypothetical protein